MGRARVDVTSDDLTIRLAGRDVVVSADDGQSFACDGLAMRIRSELAAATPIAEAPRSAATLASLAEARHCRPVKSSTYAIRGHPPPTGPSVAIGPLARPDEGIAPLLRRRRSIRELRPCTLADLSTLLFNGARVLDEWLDRDGTNISRRPHPSAGGCHPLSILVLVDEIEDLEPGAWVFDPSRCILADAGWGPDRIDEALFVASDALSGLRPPSLLFAVAEPERTLSRYPAGTAHLWRDAGALLTTLHLLAASLDLASCIVGISGVLGHEDAAQIDLGALAFGRP